MTLPLQQLHDATLLAIRFDWVARSCTFEFAGAPGLIEPFVVEFSNVSELVVPATDAWGPSASVLEVKDLGSGGYHFAMQSGDTIRVVALGYSFKPKPLRGATESGG